MAAQTFEQSFKNPYMYQQQLGMNTNDLWKNMYPQNNSHANGRENLQIGYPRGDFFTQSEDIGKDKRNIITCPDDQKKKGKKRMNNGDENSLKDG